MKAWQILVAGGAIALVTGVAVLLVWIARAKLNPAQAITELRAWGQTSPACRDGCAGLRLIRGRPGERAGS